MDKVETLEDFYKNKGLPEQLRNEIGHFNVFNLLPIAEGAPQSIPYKRRDFYKIMLVIGNSKVHFADKVIEVKKQALSFSNPQIPYKWEHLDNIRRGVYCIFSKDFFHQFGDLYQYEVFQPQGNHLFELTDEQVEDLQKIYNRMFETINSDYIHKYDLLRNLIFELLHFAAKMQPNTPYDKQLINASQRISTLFVELLERQFPIDENHTSMHLRSASDFAQQLNVHVNHLNKAVKETLQKTTSQIIAERVLQESKIMLKHSDWTVAMIAYALGFTEATHFNNFFKKHVQVSPTMFRKNG